MLRILVIGGVGAITALAFWVGFTRFDFGLTAWVGEFPAPGHAATYGVAVGIFSAIAWAIGSIFGNRFLWAFPGPAVFNNWFNAFAAGSAALSLGYIAPAASLCHADSLQGQAVASGIGWPLNDACQQHGMDESLLDPLGDLRRDVTNVTRQLSQTDRRVEEMSRAAQQDRDVAQQDSDTSRRDRAALQKDLGTAQQQIAASQQAIADLQKRMEQLEHPKVPPPRAPQGPKRGKP